MSNQVSSRQALYRSVEVMLLVVALLAGAATVFFLTDSARDVRFMTISGLVLTACLIVLIRLWMNPDRVRAGQTDAVLNLASRMLACMDGGLKEESAQRICDMLLPETSAIAVAITDKQVILGYSGRGQETNPQDAPIRTAATHAVLDSGEMQVLFSSDAIGFPDERRAINGAIVVPLTMGAETVGTLKFYYPSARKINETQRSIAAGFGELLSTQLAATALEEQKRMVTSMELKALQSQINPHFLFNTINTIASFIRTDPAKARVLLREFAVFYRRTLEDASDLIPLAREVDQTERYLRFEMARFGEDRLQLTCSIPSQVSEMLVPAFMVQPLVENAVKHAMPATGCLHISICAEPQANDLVIRIIDDGVGMSEERRANIMETSSQTGLGIAVRNIRDRIQGYFGAESFMRVESEEGSGTTITLFLKGGCFKNPLDLEEK